MEKYTVIVTDDRFGDYNEEKEILSSLTLSSSDLMNGFSPVIVNTGNAFLIVPLIISI